MIDYQGQQLGNYRLTRLLGTGGMASVYLAEHVHLGTQAAIKVLSPRLQRTDLERFLTEARIIARLEHPHIVRVLEFGVEEDLPFLVMSYAPGGSLRQLHPTGTVLPLDTVISYVKQVAQALQYAHDEHIIHRDIKPENMLLGRRNEVLLSDFGLAVLSQSADAQQVLQTAGTIAYMAPEQIQGRPTPASDQYALGVVVYEWLCGKRPFSGSLAEIASQHLSIAPPPLCEQVSTIPSAVEEVVLKTLSKDPHERFATVQAFALTLEEAYRETSSGQTQLELSSANVKGNHASPLHSLPAQLTALIGREQEVAAACALLRRPEVRLLTLTGTGGIGKTRLALQLATELSDDFADGVCFVSLAPISDPDLVLATIAQTFGLKEASRQSWLDRLNAFLLPKQCLLLLDNFEQVVTAAPQLVTLLQACSRLKVLVTSRRLLRVTGEHHFPVAPLSVPDLKHLPQNESLVEYAALALFVQRAQALKPDFQLTATNARAVAEICVRLDGIPLAIELAAARSTLLSPQALLARLSRRFALLTSGGQDAPARQQTLRNTIAWSYNLLDASEQRLFRRLVVFVGGCTLEAIEAVCSQLDDGAGGVLEGVASLMDKNLLHQWEQEDDEPRLGMLETLREYGLEALSASGEMEVTRQAHAQYYLALAEESGSNQRDARLRRRLEQEHDNLRTVMRWLVEPGASAHSTGSRKEMALRLGAGLTDFWVEYAHSGEALNFLEQALVESEGIAATVRVKALTAASGFAYLNGDAERAELRARESLTLYRELGDKAGIARSLNLLGYAAEVKLNLAVARSRMEESLALFREIGDTYEIGWQLHNLANVAFMQGEYTRARALSEEGLPIFREMGVTWGIVRLLVFIATIMHYQGDHIAGAHTLLEEAMALCKEQGFRWGMAFILATSGEVALAQGDLRKACLLAEESALLYREVDFQGELAELPLPLLGRAATAQGDYTVARASFEESLTIARRFGNRVTIALGLEGLANVVALQGEPVWAARLWGAAEVLHGSIGLPIPPIKRINYERSVGAARAQLGEESFLAAWAEGRAMTPDQVLAAKERAIEPAEQHLAHPGKSPVAFPDGLTAREVEVLRLVAQGLTDVQVAEQLVISPRTVNTHLKSIYGKIQVSSRSAATRYALEHQLV